MPTFDNISQLEAYLKSQIKETMNKEVNEVVRSTLKENVIEEVYDQFEPTQYERTGGLYQDRNIESNIIDTGDGVELSVRSIRKEDGRDIAKIIETGKGYSWKKSQIAQSEMQRPFHEVTQKEIEDKGLAKKAMKKGLRSRGLDVE